MKLNAAAELFVPDGLAEGEALARTTHLAVGSHQDDLEIMAFHGILACFQQPDKWFTGAVVTDGSGSPRAGVYGAYSDDDMIAVRKQEQNKAAAVGEYAAQFLLGYSSSAIKDPANEAPVEDFVAILEASRPEIVYCHNLADKHDTHVGTALKLIEAIRRLPVEARPKKLYGCEVWRDLDWMMDEDKIAFDVSGHENLQAALLGVFDSQVCGGKRYDLATLGRRRAHATYHASHGVDEATGLTFAMDLTPLVTDTGKDPVDLVRAHMKRFEDDVLARFATLR
jgi:LmbE family N-acetylglucosaminyl deacetylase